MNDKIRILHVIKSLGRGGAEMLLPETLRLHDQRKFEFHYIYFLPWKDQMVSAIQECGGKVTCVRASNNIQLILRVRRIVRYVQENKIQMIHAHLPWAGIVARLAGTLSGIPILYTEHNKQERYHRLTRWMNLATMNWLTKVIAVSADVEASIKRNKLHLQTPVQTILNGVNTERFTADFAGAEEIKKQLNIPVKALVVGTVAVFRFQKRLDLWMEIAQAVLKESPGTHFVIVGDGPLKDELMEKRTALGLESQLHFAGLQPEVRPYFAAFDLYLMTSVFEGLPIALLEAMASENAVVTTDAGGIKELVRHNVDGLMCGVDEPEKLVGYLIQLLTDPVQRKELRERARQRIVEAFSMKRMVADLEEVYRATAASNL